MIKRFCMLILAALLVCFLLGGMASAEVVSSTTIPTEPFSWEYLATIAGATLVTMLIVQLLKLPLGKVWKIPTRLIVYLIALIISLLATHFTVGLTWENGILTAVNAVIIALAAMGGYEVTIKKLEQGE
jgi:uncharacterized membrane protein AbrB (regulator of aidB expression)